MEINKADVLWNYAATFLRIAATSLLLPFLLRLSSETAGIWSVFITINALIGVFDFGFNASFTRNVTYVLSGIQKLKASGISTKVVHADGQVDYDLLKGMIAAMQWFYLRAAIIFFFIGRYRRNVLYSYLN